MTQAGLRKAKREATAHALARAAYELAREHGLDGFTIEDVAARAGYSRRTFANHFGGKEEAVAAVAAEQVRHALDTVPKADDLPLVDWLHHVARQQLAGGLLVALRDLRVLAESHPSLRPHLFEVQAEIRETAREAVMAGLGERTSRTYAHLLVGAAYGALSCVLDGSLPVRIDGVVAHDPAGDLEGIPSLDDFLRTTFGYLSTGFGRAPDDG